MRVQVTFYEMAREAVGRKTTTLTLPDAATVGTLLEHLAEEYPDIRYYILDEAGGFRDYLTYAVNNVEINSLDRFSTLLVEGDRVLVMPPIGGG